MCLLPEGLARTLQEHPHLQLPHRGALQVHRGVHQEVSLDPILQDPQEDRPADLIVITMPDRVHPQAPYLVDPRGDPRTVNSLKPLHVSYISKKRLFFFM